MLAALSPKVVGEILNVGTGKETSVKHLANLIMEVSGRDIQLIYIDRRDIDNLRRRVLNIEKIRKNLRWIPSTPLEEGLSKTYEWLISNKLKETKKTTVEIPSQIVQTGGERRMR